MLIALRQWVSHSAILPKAPIIDRFIIERVLAAITSSPHPKPLHQAAPFNGSHVTQGAGRMAALCRLHGAVYVARICKCMGGQHRACCRIQHINAARAPIDPFTVEIVLPEPQFVCVAQTIRILGPVEDRGAGMERQKV